MTLIKQKIEKWVKDKTGIEQVVLVHPKEIKNGDFTLILNQGDIEEAVKKLDENKIPEIEKVELVKPRFINLFLSPEFFADSVKEINEKGEGFGESGLLDGQKIFIEHTQPNPFKEFHIGHLMNNAIGESVGRILKANGAEVKVCSYHGNVGLHVAKAVWALQKERKEKTEVNLTNAFAFGQAYARGSVAYETNEKAKKEIIEINKRIYDKSNQEINLIYDWGEEESLKYFDYLYKRLDSHFDFNFYESESGEIGKKLVLEFLEKGVFEKGENGAVIFKGENFKPKIHTRVFLNSEGLPTYEAKEVGLAQIKKDKFQYNESITVTANEQDPFFNVVEVAIGQIFPELNGKLHHLSHGMLKLPTGKMSSRTGDVITAESLIEQVKEKVLEKIKDRELPEEEKQKIAEVVAIGAIKYSILRQAIGGDIIFDFEKSLSFEGDSGPYLQYTYVRAKSVLEKAQGASLKVESNRLEDVEIMELERVLYRFPEVVERSAREYAPHHLVTYLTELASVFNSFYAKEKIIDPENPDVSAYKLALTSALAHTLKNGLHLLGIRVPERM